MQGFQEGPGPCWQLQRKQVAREHLHSQPQEEPHRPQMEGLCSRCARLCCLGVLGTQWRARDFWTNVLSSAPQRGEDGVLGVCRAYADVLDSDPQPQEPTARTKLVLVEGGPGSCRLSGSFLLWHSAASATLLETLRHGEQPEVLCLQSCREKAVQTGRPWLRYWRQ